MTTLLSVRKKRLASSFVNPRLLQIHFHTLRHWKLTTYAHEVKDPFLVQIFARHRDMKSTGRYIHYEKILYKVSSKDEWIVRAVRTVEEATELGVVGFEPYLVINGVQLVRKRK
jgi:integrase